MALASISRAVNWPFGETANQLYASGTLLTLDAAGEYWAYVGPARETMAISHVGLRPNTITGSGAVEIRIETVSLTDGKPTGSLWATDTNVLTGALTATTWAVYALTATANISAGQIFALKVLYTSGTTATISYSSGYTYLTMPLPYYVNAIPTATLGALQFGAQMALGNSSSTFYQVEGLDPNGVLTNANFNNTNSAKKGARFQVPFKCRCVGLRGARVTGTGDYNVVIFDDGGSELSSSSTLYDGNINTGGHTASTTYFDNPVVLSPGVWYRAVFEPTSATNIRFDYHTLPSADVRSALPGGINFYLTEFATATWTDSTTKVPNMDLIFDQFDDGAGVAGGGLKLVGTGGLAG